MESCRVYVVLITAPPGEAAGIARRLVEERVAACVNVVERVRSIYWWEGRVQEDSESLLVAKTRGDALERLVSLVREIHPYQVPEVLALPVERGLREYLDWVCGEVRASGGHGGAEAGGGAREEE